MPFSNCTNRSSITGRYTLFEYLKFCILFYKKDWVLCVMRIGKRVEGYIENWQGE